MEPLTQHDDETGDDQSVSATDDDQPYRRPLMTKVLYVAAGLLLAVLLATWAFLLLSPADKGEAAPVPTEFSSAAGYTLTHPGFADPITDKRLPPAADAIFVMDSTGDAATMVTTYAAAPGAELTATSAVELTAASFPGIELDPATDTTLDGAPAFAIKGTSEMRTYRFVVAQRGNSAAILSLAAPTKQFAAASTAFDELLDSFAFNASTLQVKKATTTTTAPVTTTAPGS